MHKPPRHPATPRHAVISSSVVSVGLGPSDQQDVANIVLALRTLGSFNFEGHSLLQFVRRCADYFLTSETQQIRLEAVRFFFIFKKHILIKISNSNKKK